MLMLKVKRNLVLRKIDNFSFLYKVKNLSWMEIYTVMELQLKPNELVRVIWLLMQVILTILIYNEQHLLHLWYSSFTNFSLFIPVFAKIKMLFVICFHFTFLYISRETILRFREDVSNYCAVCRFVIGNQSINRCIRPLLP